MAVEVTEWDVRLDPAEVATNRVELNLNTGPIRIGQTGIDWGDAAIEAFMAKQKWGSSPVDYDVPNRVVTIPLGLGMDESGTFDQARVRLHQKIALIQREGGWLKRARSAVKLYADVVNATLHEPDQWGATGAVEEATLTLECLPDFYGDEITCDAIAAVGRLTSKLQAGGVDELVLGDYPARCRLIVTDTSGNDQDGVIWGFRARHYDAAGTAALFYQAESLTGVNGAASAARTGASNGSTMKITGLPAGPWTSMLLTDVGGAQCTHIGTYRVWARVYATDAGSQVRLVWGAGSLSAPTTNDPVSVPDNGAFYLVDLGLVRIDPTPVGSTSWQGVIQVSDPVGVGTFEVDTVTFQPVDESSGRESAIIIPPPSVIANPLTPALSTFTDDATGGTVAWVLERGGADWKCDMGSGPVTSHYLKISNLGFNVPATATILGFGVTVTRRLTRADPQLYVRDAVVQLMKAGALVGNNKALTGVTWPVSTGTASYGGTSDLWGAAWAAADVNNIGFGLKLQVTGNSMVGYIYSVTVTVYYKLAGGFTVAKDVVIPANNACEIRTEGAFRPDVASGSWKNVSMVIGDLPRVPPSGLEGRKVELFVKVSRGDLGADPINSQDSGIDSFTAQVKYRPCYLLRP